MGIGISAQEGWGCLDPHPTLQKWGMRGNEHSECCSTPNTTTADPWVHQQHLTFQPHTGFLCWDLKKKTNLFFIFQSQFQPLLSPGEEIETRTLGLSSGRGWLQLAPAHTISLSTSTGFLEGHKGDFHPEHSLDKGQSDNP